MIINQFMNFVRRKRTQIEMREKLSSMEFNYCVFELFIQLFISFGCLKRQQQQLLADCPFSLIISGTAKGKLCVLLASLIKFPSHFVFTAVDEIGLKCFHSILAINVVLIDSQLGGPIARSLLLPRRHNQVVR